MFRKESKGEGLLRLSKLGQGGGGEFYLERDVERRAIHAVTR